VLSLEPGFELVGPPSHFIRLLAAISAVGFERRSFRTAGCRAGRVPRSPEIGLPMSYRYWGENGPTYLESTMKQPRWLFRIKPDSFVTWQGVGWARRYWVENTGGPSNEEAHSSL
jgi:hypothetical protein